MCDVWCVMCGVVCVFVMCDVWGVVCVVCDVWRVIYNYVMCDV